MKHKNINYLIDKAVKNFKKNNFNQTENLLKSVLSIEDKNLFALNLMGIVQDIKKNYQSAIDYYEKVITLKPDHIESWLNKGNAFYKIKDYKKAIESYQQTIKFKSDYAEAWFNIGNAFQEIKDFNNAIDHYDKAIKFKSDYADAFFNKGCVLHELKKFDEALINYNRAISLQPNYSKIWSNLGNLLYDLKRYEEALQHYDQAIKLKPDYAEAWSNKGYTLHELMRFEEALQHYDQAIKLNPEHVQACSNKAHTKLLTGNFEEGWILYESRWKKKEFQQYRHSKYTELTSLENLNEKKILVWHEQGYGDVIQFSRYVAKLIVLGANITFEVQKDLLNFFSNQFNCHIVSNINEINNLDYQIPLLKLPKLFKTNINTIPDVCKITIDPSKILEQKKFLQNKENKINIGLAVSGNPNYKHNQKRSIPLEYFKPLLNYGNFFLIQKQLNQTDQKFLNENPLIAYIGDKINNFTDTASIIENMDLIITVDTSLIHLAGTLNKKSFLMLPWCPEWRWLLNVNYSPWYPSVKIFRQKSMGNWDSVIIEIQKEIINEKLD